MVVAPLSVVIVGLLAFLSSVIAFSFAPRYASSSMARSRKLLLHVERSGSNSSEKKATANLSQDELEKMEELEKMMEYEYNEADFADYVSDYSANDDDAFDEDDDEEDDVFNDNYDTKNLDIRGDGGIKKGGGDSSSILSGYDESSYTSIGGFDLSPFEKHAREVFLTYALQVQSTLDYSDVGSQIIANELSNTQQQRIDNAAIMKKDLFDMLQSLDINASVNESDALFKYLDIDDDGQVTLDEVRYEE